LSKYSVHRNYLFIHFYKQKANETFSQQAEQGFNWLITKFYFLQRADDKHKMAAVAIEFTEEQLNYYRICYVVTDIITEGLRSIFKQEWDNRYKTTLGEWKDEPGNGLAFKTG